MSSNQKIKISVLEGIVREIVKTLAKEMSGTAAASPVTGPNFLVKKKVYEDTSANDVMNTFHVKTWENLRLSLSLFGLDIRKGYVKAQEKTEAVLGAAGFTFDPATNTYSNGDKSQTVIAFPQRVYVWKYKNFGKILKNTNHLAEWLTSKSKDFIGQVGNSEYIEPTPVPSVRRTESKEPDDTERAVDTTRKSNCCGKPPDKEVAKDNSGRCSKCKDGAMFSGGKKKIKENEFDGKKWPKHNAKISNAEMEEAKTVAAKIWQPVYLTQFHSTSLDGKTKFFVVYLHSYTGDKHYMYKDANGKWFYAKGTGLDAKYVPADEYLTETVTGDVSGFNVPGCFSRKGGSQKGVEGSAALGYDLTPIGKKEMQRHADKIYEGKDKPLKDGTPICNKCHKPLRYAGQIECQKCGKIQESQQAALGKKFGKAQRSYDAMSEPEPEQCYDCKKQGHDWTVKAYRDPKSGKLTTWRKCDHCGVTTNPSTK